MPEHDDELTPTEILAGGAFPKKAASPNLRAYIRDENDKLVEAIMRKIDQRLGTTETKFDQRLNNIEKMIG